MKRIARLSDLFLPTLLVFLMAVAASRLAFAQTADTSVRTPGQEIGITPSGVYDFKSEAVNLENGNVNLTLPLMQLSSSRGTFNLNMLLNSKQYTPFINELPYNPDNGTMAIGIMAGWRTTDYSAYYLLNIPYLEANWGALGSEYGPSGNPGEYTKTHDIDCTYGVMYVDETGAHHSFRNVSGCYGTYSHPEMETPVSEAYDGFLLRMDTSDVNDIRVFRQDGSTVHFKTGTLSNGTAVGEVDIVDKNGNRFVILSDGAGGGTITDPLNRVISMTYQNGDLVISGRRENGQSRTVTIHQQPVDSPVTLSYTCPDSYQNPYAANTLFGGGAHYSISFDGAVPRTYGVDVNGALEPTKISLPGGGYVRYEYASYPAPQRMVGQYVTIDCSSVDHREIKREVYLLRY